MSQPVRILGKHERATCTVCGGTIRIMVWPRGRELVCHRCIEAFDRRACAPNESPDGSPSPARRRRMPLPPVGTVLAGRYKGVDYEATITPAGVEYGGRAYRTLSAAAQAITHGPISGPRFWRASAPQEAVA
jgi:hypothetical protein